jgi:hypothetical protein
MARSRLGKSNYTILIVLLALVVLVSWLAIKNSPSSEGLELPPSLNTQSMGPPPIEVPQFAADPEAMDYQLIYGQAQDGVGMGPGASLQTTNDWSLL